jgi:hypothetical protein
MDHFMHADQAQLSAAVDMLTTHAVNPGGQVSTITGRLCNDPACLQAKDKHELSPTMFCVQQFMGLHFPCHSFDFTRSGKIISTFTNSLEYDYDIINYLDGAEEDGTIRAGNNIVMAGETFFFELCGHCNENLDVALWTDHDSPMATFLGHVHNEVDDSNERTFSCRGIREYVSFLLRGRRGFLDPSKITSYIRNRTQPTHLTNAIDHLAYELLERGVNIKKVDSDETCGLSLPSSPTSTPIAEGISGPYEEDDEGTETEDDLPRGKIGGPETARILSGARSSPHGQLPPGSDI